MRSSRALLGALAGLAALAAASAARAEPYYLIVAGLGGEARYEREFSRYADELAAAARRTAGGEEAVQVLRGEDATGEALRAAFESLAGRMEPADSLIVFLIGHGSYDGDTYKLNLKGRDLDGRQLGELLSAVPARAQLIVNATSASGAVLEQWAADGRIVVTATRSGAERNATRFAEHWAAALSSEEADVDKNGSVSAQEAFDYASRSVAESYEAEGTLATEHPQISGDAAARFTVARLTERPAALTPELERLTSRLTDLENEIEALRLRRDEMEPEAYLNQLQELLVQLATVQQQIDAAGGESTGAGTDGAAGRSAGAETDGAGGGSAGAETDGGSAGAETDEAGGSSTGTESEGGSSASTEPEGAGGEPAPTGTDGIERRPN